MQILKYGVMQAARLNVYRVHPMDMPSVFKPYVTCEEARKRDRGNVQFAPNRNFCNRRAKKLTADRGAHRKSEYAK